MQTQYSKSKYVLLVGLFLLSGLVSWRLYFKAYNQRDAMDIHSFPKHIGDWIGQDIPMSEKDYEMLETRNAFTRAYKNSKGQTVYLFIVYSKDNRKVSHPPEICYTGSGATIISRKPAQVMLDNGHVLKATKLLLEYNFTHHVAYYWYMVGGNFTPNYWVQQLLFSFQNLLGRSTSSALIRVSTGATAAHDEWGFDSAQIAKDFIKVMLPALSTLFQYN